MKCEFCDYISTTNGNLIRHKKNSKKCILLQNQKQSTFKLEEKILELEKIVGEKDKEKEEIVREKDEEILELKMFLKKQNKKISGLTLKIKELETANSIYSKDHDTIVDLAKEPKKKINNINVSNNYIYDPEKIKKIFDEKYDRFTLAEGQKGIAKFAVDNILTDEDGNLTYICADPSRGIFKYQNENGEIEKDVHATKLTNLLFDAGLKSKTRELGQKIWTNDDGSHNNKKFGMYQPSVYEISSMDSDNSKFRNKLACLTCTK